MKLTNQTKTNLYDTKNQNCVEKESTGEPG